jgi:ribosomal protein S18 acetylase RimI-like enzyme
MKDVNSLILECELECKNEHFISHCRTVDWGTLIHVMERTGKAFGRVYQYDNEPTVAYLDSLSVDEKSRRQGLGTKLQEIRERIGVRLGATESFLWVKKDSWMHDWYKRRGYIDYSEKESQEGEGNFIWMRKLLVGERK